MDPVTQTWTTAELQQDYEVIGFAAGLVVVRRKSDNALGSMEFGGSPRLYSNFVPHENGTLVA